MMKMVPPKQEDLFPANFLYQPWLIQCYGASKPTKNFINPMESSIEEREIVDMQGKLCFGCIDEWLFLWDEQSKECFFLEPNSLSKVHLPSLPENAPYLMNFSLISSADDRDCAIIFIGHQWDEISEVESFFISEVESFFIYCRPLDKRWTTLPLHGEIPMGQNTIIYEGKLYAYKRGAVLIFDVASLLEGRVDMTTLLIPKLPMYPRRDKASVYLVESCGDIYLVRISGYGNSQVTYIDVHRLDVSSMLWQRVNSIGDCAFFLSSQCYASVRATDVGAQCNCIYCLPPLMIENEKRIYRFNLDDHTITFSLISEEETQYENTCWFVPTRPRSMIRNSSIQSTLILNEATKDEIFTEDESMKNISMAWNNLPIDLLELLLPYLSLVDSIRLPAVCKAWNFISNPFSKAKTWPWLMYHTKTDNTCKLLDPFNAKEYTTNIGKTSGGVETQMLFSKDGWVVVLHGDFSVFIINPLLEEIVELPYLEGLEDGFHGITFTSVPTSQDCIVFGVCTDQIANSIEIYQWCLGEKNWSKMAFPIEAPLDAANTSPVFFHGELYCLGEKGQLGVFNPEDKTWRVLDKPEPFYLENEILFRGRDNCFLLELDGELVSVFKCNYGNYDISILELDRLKMEWVMVDDLTDWTLFLNTKSSFAKPSPHKSWSNKIFFSAFNSGTCATYCMESETFNMDFSDTNMPLDCVWLEPNLTRN